MDMVARTVTAYGLKHTVDHITANRPTSGSLLNALANAEARLLTHPWSFDGAKFCITSRSHPNHVYKLTSSERCDCLTPSGLWCWHRAGYMIVAAIAAIGVLPIAPIPLPAVLDEDELPASFLDGDFDFADDTQLTAPATATRDPEPAFMDADPRPVYVPLPRLRMQTSREHVPAAGSDFAKVQDLADELFAA